jgi:hypothetical protein
LEAFGSSPKGEERLGREEGGDDEPEPGVHVDYLVSDFDDLY